MTEVHDRGTCHEDDNDSSTRHKDDRLQLIKWFNVVTGTPAYERTSGVTAGES